MYSFSRLNYRWRAVARNPAEYWIRSAVLCGLLWSPVPGLAQTASPGQIRRKLGIYVWGEIPSLRAAVQQARALGTNQVIRAFIGPWSDNSPYQDDLRPLFEKALDPAYQEMFRQFQVIMLTAYDSASYRSTYAGLKRPRLGDTPQLRGRAVRMKGGHPAEPSLHFVYYLSLLEKAHAQALLDEVKDEFYHLALELAKLDRTFILSNWEGEHDVPEESLWPHFVLYLQARLDGIVQGREEARRRGNPGRVFAAFEFTVLPGFSGRASGLSDIGARLKGLDYLSYSAWHSIGHDFDASAMKHSFRSAVRQIRSFARSQRLPTRVIVGEFGEYWDLYPSGERMRAIIDACLEEEVSYLFNWTLYEQPGERDEWGRDASHFGKFFADGTLTPQGKVFQHWLVGSAVENFQEPRTQPTPAGVAQ